MEFVDPREPRLRLVQGDITTLEVSAIVNAANEALLGGGGVDGAIHRAAGAQLLEECKRIGGCPTGEARVTFGYFLPALHVIHTVGPIWHDGTKGEPELLANCYRSSLAIAEEYGMEDVAFAAISTGVYGYPPDQAAAIAVNECRTFLAAHEEPEGVILVAFDSAAFAVIQGALEAV